MRFLACICALALGGCSTTAELASGAPEGIYQSPKSRDAVAECLMNRLSAPGIRPEKEVGANATTVGFTSLGGIAKPGLYYFAIRDAGAGSSIEAHKMKGIDMSAAQSCF